MLYVGSKTLTVLICLFFGSILPQDVVVNTHFLSCGTWVIATSFSCVLFLLEFIIADIVCILV